MEAVKNVWIIRKTRRGWRSSFGTIFSDPRKRAGCVMNRINAYETANHETKSQAVKYAKGGGLMGTHRGEIRIEEAEA